MGTKGCFNAVILLRIKGLSAKRRGKMSTMQAKRGKRGVENGFGGRVTGSVRRRRRLGRGLERISASVGYATLSSGIVHHAFSDPTSSHFETGLVSRGILELLASWHSLPSLSRARGPAAESACSHLGLFLADGPERHGFCSLSIEEAEKHRQDSLGDGWGGL